MVTQGIPASNRRYAMGITRKGAAARTTRAIYATKLAEAQAAAAVSAALSTRTIPPGRVPYAGLYGMGAVDPNTGVDDFGFDLTDDPSTNAPSVSAGLSNQGQPWTPSYTDSTSGSGSSWSSVLSTFFGGIGSGIGQRIAGQPKTVVPLPSSGPSAATVLLVAGAVAIPVIFLLAKKG